jgi:hypothetical protein
MDFKVGDIVKYECKLCKVLCVKESCEQYEGPIVCIDYKFLDKECGRKGYSTNPKELILIKSVNETTPRSKTRCFWW